VAEGPTHSPIPWETLEALLHRVQKPARYVGGEFNAVIKDWDAMPLHVCLAFPDLYELGMSNFALQIFYDLLNRRSDTLAERAYLPAPDMNAALRAAHLPLYTLESYRPVAAFDLLAISTAYEQLYTNLLEFLDLAGLPVESTARDERHPLVIGGGHGAFNPEPLADFVDAFVIGEGEAVLEELVTALLAIPAADRETQLDALVALPGVYVPRRYRPIYAADGRFQALEPRDAHTPARITKRILPQLPPTPVRQLVPNVDTVHNRAVIELQRGCSNGCRFCQAGIITRPIRERPPAEVLADVRAVTDATGYEEVALLSLSSADYTDIAALLEALQTAYASEHISFSLPSLRLDAFSVELADALSQGRRSGFTFAPEAATDALRARINKNIRTETVLEVAEMVFTRGWRTVKLYFMIGLPGESDEDVQEIVELAHQILRIGRQARGRKVEVHVSVNTFVPKPHTVFQWEPLADEETVLRRQAILQQGLRARGLRLAWHDYAESQLEALLARGDRRLAPVVKRAWELGARFDAWDEWRNPAAWEQAIAESGLDVAAYVGRRYAISEPLPWEHLDSGVNLRYLQEDYMRSQRGELLPDCRVQCHGCGILQHYASLQEECWQCPTRP